MLSAIAPLFLYPLACACTYGRMGGWSLSSVPAACSSTGWWINLKNDVSKIYGSKMRRSTAGGTGLPACLPAWHIILHNIISYYTILHAHMI